MCVDVVDKRGRVFLPSPLPPMFRGCRAIHVIPGETSIVKTREELNKSNKLKGSSEEVTTNEVIMVLVGDTSTLNSDSDGTVLVNSNSSVMDISSSSRSMFVTSGVGVLLI